MSNIDKQALRQLATDAHELGIIKRYSKGLDAQRKFYAAATPLVIRALLDELEAAEKRIAELEERTPTVKMPEPFKLAKSSSGLTYYYADEVDKALAAASINVEAE
ncbi:ead/Ea22-like family protein [Citrobacter koseri]|uniref:ead/Ea22-like family protein n=1 Tax=Citrobacter koseri TaxID=545 RepID=UPI004042926C